MKPFTHTFKNNDELSFDGEKLKLGRDLVSSRHINTSKITDEHRAKGIHAAIFGKYGISEELLNMCNEALLFIKNEAAKKFAKNVEGGIELKEAMTDLSVELDKYDAWMKKAHRNSFNRDVKPNPEKAQSVVDDLKSKYPRAAAWTKWSAGNPATTSGYQMTKAADALENGASIEDCAKIADDYDQWV